MWRKQPQELLEKYRVVKAGSRGRTDQLKFEGVSLVLFEAPAMRLLLGEAPNLATQSRVYFS